MLAALRLCCLLLAGLAMPALAGVSLRLTQAHTHTEATRGYAAAPHTVNVQQWRADDWQPVTLPHAEARPLVPPRRPDVSAPTPDGLEAPPTITTWYRLEVPPLPAGGQPLFVYLPRWKSDGQIAVYADGEKLYSSHTNERWNGWNIPLWVAVGDDVGARPPREVLIRIQRPHDTGGGISSVWLGDAPGLLYRYQLRYFLQVQLTSISSSAFFAVGCLALLVWVRQREQKLYLLMFFIATASYLRTLHYHVGEQLLILPDPWFSWLTVNALFWLITALHFFLCTLYARPLRPIDWGIALATFGVALVTLPTGLLVTDVYVLAPLLYIGLMLTCLLVVALGMQRSRQTGVRDGVWFSGWILLVMMLWVHDWFLQTNRIDIEGLYLGPYTNIVAFVLLIRTLYNQYTQALDRVQETNANLHIELDRRERELLQSHQQLREVETRQALSHQRQRIMQDMHDGMGLSLRSALMAVEGGQTNTDVVAEVLRCCIDDLKLAIDSMEPTHPDLLLLLATLRFRLEPRLQSAGIELSWDVEDVPPLPWMNQHSALHILRMAQETFSNTIRHAGATHIRLSTRVLRDAVEVSIQDNGKGFDMASALQRAGKGLGNVQRRAATIGARVTWESTGQGTRMTLCLPLTDPVT
jgi:signal transduction histidine kinase